MGLAEFILTVITLMFFGSICGVGMLNEMHGTDIAKNLLKKKPKAYKSFMVINFVMSLIITIIAWLAI